LENEGAVTEDGKEEAHSEDASSAWQAYRGKSSYMYAVGAAVVIIVTLL